MRPQDGKSTGVSHDEIPQRRIDVARAFTDRSSILRQTLRDGAAWERHTTNTISALSKKRFKKKRIGVRAAKDAEKLLAAKDALRP